MNRTARRRPAVTLVELLAVVTLMGVFSTVVMVRFGRSMLTNMGAQSECRRLALDLLRMQRSTITSGDNHGVVFLTTAGKATGYRVVAGLSPAGGNYVTTGATVDVDSPRTFQSDLDVTPSHSVMGYSFEGQAGSAYRIVLSGPHRECTIDVIPITGAVLTSERFK